MKKFDLKKGLLLLLLIFAATTYSQTANTIRLTSNGVAIGGLNPDEGTLLDQDDTVLTFDSAGVTTVNAADPDYTLGSNTGAVTFTDALSKSITVRLKAGLVVDQTVGSTYGAITTTGGIDRAGDGAIGVRPATGTTNWGIENGEGITFGFSTSNLPTSVTLQITRIYFSTFGLAESGVIVNRRDTSKKLDFTGPETGTNMIKDVASLGLYVRGGSTIYDMVSIFNNSSTVQSWRVTQIEFRLVETNSLTTVWNGSVWSAFTPGPAMDAVIEGNYSALASGGFSAKKLTINSGTLSIEATKAVKVDNEVINNAGPTGIVVYSGGGLRQVNNTVNTGAITVKRNSNPLSRLDSKAWSSPIANQNLLSFSPATLSTNFLNYNEGTNQFVSEASPSTTEFSTAGGYLIGMPDDAVTAPLTQTFEGNFIGITNNGDITKAITYGSSSSLGYNLVGNPYPSAIIANSFINANIANIDGSIYFYRKTSSTAGSAYAMYSRLGATNLVASSADTNAEIPVGEGFIVKAKNNANLTFTNAMRIASVPATLTANRVWLNLTNTAGVFSQALVGYVADGTLGVDNYDGKYINDSPVALTSNVNNEEYTIQGRPAFTPSDEVGLNFKTDQAGSYTIGVDRFDGVFTAGQEIYLKDNTTGTYTDLRTNSYTFTAAAGTDNSRFVLRYTAASYPIAATAGDNGSVSGAGTYDTYSTATLIATPSEGYGLVNWTENGIQVSASPTYTFTVTGARTLVANFGFTNVTDVTACASYTWNGVEYTASGIYVGQTIDGVVQKLNLTLTPKPTAVTTNANICSGESYNWSVNSTNYTTTQTVTITNDGCTADQVLNLTVTPKPTTVTTNATICSGESYNWSVNSTNYTASQTVTITNDGCTADQVLNLTVTPKPTAVTTNATICSGESYNWSVDSTNYTTTQTVTITNDGCTADQILNLTVTPKPTTVTTNATICSGASYTWSANGQAYTTAQTALTITNDACTADQVLNLTVIPAANAGANGTLSLNSSPSDADLFAALTGADAGGSWTRPSSGFVGVYTYTVNAISPCTGSDTSTVAVTSSSVIPSSPYAVCTGVTVATVTAGTTLKFYKDNIPTTAALAAGEKLKAQIYYVTDTAAGLITDPRTAVTVTLTALVPAPAVSSLESSNICKYIGTDNLVTFTATPAVGTTAPTSYSWNVPSGATIVGTNGGSTIQVNFHNAITTVGAIGSVTVDSNNTLGCPSGKPKALALTTKLPKAPKLALSSTAPVTTLIEGLPVTTITAVKKAGNFVGATNTLYLIVTDPSLTADHYDFTLPEGVSNVTGAASVEGSTTLYRATYNGTSTVLTFNLGGVTASNTALAFTVTSAGGCLDPSSTKNAKTLSVARAEAGTPKGLALTDATLADANATPPVLPIAVKKLDSYTGSLKTRALTLTATPNASAGSEATSYRWVLPAAAAIVNSSATAVVGQANTYTSTSNVISINLSNVGSELEFIFKVYGVNGNGESLLSKDITLKSAAPKAPAAIYAGTNTSLTGTKFLVYSPSCGTVTISVPAVFGVDNNFEIISGGATIASHEAGSNVATIDLSTAASSIVLKSTVVIRAIAYTATGPIYKDYTIKIGTACSAPTRIAPEAANATEKFSAVAYPNPAPATEGFRVKSSNGKSFGVQVYDMLGRSIEQRQMSSDAQIGSNYAKGVYNVIVSQGANVKTLRVIKN